MSDVNFLMISCAAVIELQFIPTSTSCFQICSGFPLSSGCDSKKSVMLKAFMRLETFLGELKVNQILRSRTFSEVELDFRKLNEKQ